MQNDISDTAYPSKFQERPSLLGHLPGTLAVAWLPKGRISSLQIELLVLSSFRNISKLPRQKEEHASSVGRLGMGSQSKKTNLPAKGPPQIVTARKSRRSRKASYTKSIFWNETKPAITQEQENLRYYSTAY
jgi:hypothetical protein